MSVDAYANSANQLIARGVRTEHPFREALATFLRSAGSDVAAINDPGGTEHGNPDFHVLRNDVRIGYVETKPLAFNLSAFEGSEQFTRYLAGFANLLVTNYTEFRWYTGHNAEPNLRVS